MHVVNTQILDGFMKYVKIMYMGKPSFIIIGAMKSGTTALYSDICKHSKVNKARKKELNYYWNKKGPIAYMHYRKSFPKGFSGEASPSYMLLGETADRIHSDFPDVKIIAILKNPVDRAWSHYQHGIRHGWEHLDFEDACNSEAYRLKNPKDSWDHMRYTYLQQSNYHSRLFTYFLRFENILVIQSEKYFKERQSELSRVFSFLGLDNEQVYLPPFRKSQYHGCMSLSTRAVLSRHFEKENERLYHLIGERFDWQ